ncbi:hypothetical protein BDW02DRAFT_389372 [Decorospora gaudefroyi]|uniref:Zn(2)-C6 fungal-type domain-containing protein n=1 Tax=Decorospora gaudefroyi TaxID=184978 RepID=A0A6A5KQW9_9PLEO|nr:hypothetical protein BDW02DRAFT_389372 [Decorospora gaudefroyi]
MAEKRKLGESPGSDQSRPPLDDRRPSTSSPQHSPTVVENYPRKRIAIACNVCRFRKTRCDAQKPSCGFCTELGIECAYRKPTVGDRTKSAAPPPEALSNIEKRLAQLEAKLESTQQSAHSPAILSPDASNHSDIHPPPRSESRHSSVNRVATDTTNSLNASLPLAAAPIGYNFAYRQTSTEGRTPRPSLITFRAPPYLNVESWDYSAAFYDDEISAGEQLADQCEAIVLRPVDLFRRTCRRYQQSFVENFLRWTPIFDQRTCVSVIDQAHSSAFAYSNATTCLAFLILAIGAISEDRHDNDDLTQGLEYFARGCHILERMALRIGNLEVLQCRILQASYFKFAIRPLQTWNSITQAARDCMHILSSGIVQRFSPAGQEAFNRAFWACSTLLHELEATCKMHPIGLRHFHELVPLPQFEEEDSNFYFFLAQICLRKFLTQSLEVVGYLTGQVIYVPVVTGELRKQVREWYDHLPLVVRFPLEATPLFDSRKSFLRVQYLGLQVVLSWPSVLKVLEWSHGETPIPDPEAEVATRDQARHCMKTSALLLSVADEQLMGRKMGTDFTLFPTFACLGILLVAFNHPALAYIEETRQERHIRTGYDILRPWAHLPLVRRAMERARILMQQNNLAHIFHHHADESPSSLAGISPPVIASHDWRSPQSGYNMKP